MEPGTPTLADGRPSSTSSRGSFISVEAPWVPTARPRRATLPQNIIGSSLSHELLESQDSASPVHPLTYLGAGRFYKPGLEDQPRGKHIRERASFSKVFPRPASSRSAWPSESTRDLLREAGEWLDAEYPMPEVQIPDAEWHLTSSPRTEDFASSSIGSRSTTSLASEEEADGADEKIVYVHREAKLKELLGSMQREHDRQNLVTDSREEKLKDHLKKLHDKGEKERAAQAKNMVQEPVELDTTALRKENKHEVAGDDNSERSSPPSSRTRGSIDEDSDIHHPQSDQNVPQTHAYLDVVIDIDDQFSAAIAQALNFSDLPELERSETGVSAKTEETRTELSHSSADAPDPDLCSRVSTHDLPDRPNAQISQAMKPELNDDIQGPAAQAERGSSCPSAMKSKAAISRPQMVESVVKERPATEVSKPGPLLETQAIYGSVFSDLEHLVGAFRARKGSQLGNIPTEPD